MPSPSTPIPVVCALIERDGFVLVAQRPAWKHVGLKWEFPGGKVEPGEAAAAAIVREIREELGAEVIVRRELAHCTHDYGSHVIALMPLVCALAPDSGEPRAKEHVALRWVRPEEVAALDLAAADWPVIATYRAALAGQGGD